MGLQFGSFNGFCETAALVICPLIGTSQGVVPTCYSRNVDIGKTLIFQPCKLAPTTFSFLVIKIDLVFVLLTATCFVHIVAIIMTIIMILHIRSKYTAVGRKEIVMFFYLYAFISLLAMFLDSGVIPTDNVTYPVRSILFLFFQPLFTNFKVVRGCIYRIGSLCILLFTHQWIRGFPIRRRWNAIISLGKERVFDPTIYPI